MGLLNALRLSRSLAENVTPLPVPAIASPWADSHLTTVVWSDILGADAPTRITRATAMRVPAVARGRNLIAPTIARLPLTVWAKDAQLDPSPTWTRATALGVTPYHRMLWTVDDLIFHGWSLWVVERGSSDQLLNGARIPFDWWRINPDTGAIEVKSSPAGEYRPANADEVVLIPGPHEGILTFGVDAIRQAAALAETVKDRAENPDALTELHYTGDKPLIQPEIDSTVEQWLAARRKSGGARVGFTGKNLEVKTHGTGSEQLLIEGRNAAAVELAQVIGIPAAMLDATSAGASLTYETTEGRNGQFIDYGLSTYMDPIAARLSDDDVVPRGQSVRFDTSVIRDIAPTPTGPVTED